MRTFDGLKLGPIQDANVRENFRRLNDYLRSVSGALSKSVFPGQQPPANPVPGGTSSTPPPPGQTIPLPTQGDLLYGLLTGAWAKLPIGSEGSALIVSGATPAWSGTGLTHALLSTSHTDTVASTPVRGGIIVANSTPAWAQLAVGSSGKVLHSDGTDPSWQTLVAGDLPTHGAAQHTDRTRTLFIPWQAWTDTGGTGMPTSEAVGTYPDRYSGVPMSGAGTQTRVLSSMIVPQDFTSGSATWRILYASAGVSTNPVYFELSYKVVAVSGTLTAAADTTMSGTNSPTGTVDQLSSFAIGTTITSLAAGSFVRLSLQRDSANGGDTNTDDVDFLGLQFDYTADM